MAAPSVPPHTGSCCRLGLVNIPLLLPRLCFIRRPFSICGGCFVFAAVFDGAGQPRHWQWWIPDLRRLVHNELGCEPRPRQAAGITHVPLPGTAACHMPPCRQEDAGGCPQASWCPLHPDSSSVCAWWLSVSQKHSNRRWWQHLDLSPRIFTASKLNVFLTKLSRAKPPESLRNLISSLTHVYGSAALNLHDASSPK